MWAATIFLAVCFHQFVLHFECFGSARDTSKKNSCKVPDPTNRTIHVSNLFVGAGRSAIFFERLSTDSIFKNIVLFGINNFVEMMLCLVVFGISVSLHLYLKFCFSME